MIKTKTMTDIKTGTRKKTKKYISYSKINPNSKLLGKIAIKSSIKKNLT